MTDCEPTSKKLTGRDYDPRLIINQPREAWEEHANCKGTQLLVFYPPVSDKHNNLPRGAYNEARRLCSSCVVKQECLEFAIRAHQRYGMWGGMTLRERIAYVNSSKIKSF